MDANKIIDDLGGTTAVADLCEVKPPSVSEWRVTGIPRARLQYLRAIRPDVFEKVGAGETAQAAHDANVLAAMAPAKTLDLSRVAKEGV
jgi:hypothetical protein